MKDFLKNPVTRVAKGQSGFTLIEMIVVVGIIAVLAAVIVPNIGKFIGTGESGAMDSEKESVQTAMNAMMAEHSVTTLTAASDGSKNSWSALPAGVKDKDGNDVFLDGYLQSATTVYYYCWDGTGQIDKQVKESTAGECD